jgi:putative addiction module component (TIGR02574 family)
MERDQIVEQALALSSEDRAYVADLLEQSLPGTGFMSPEIADAWSREIDRRIAAYDRGETQAISFDAALQHARDAVEQRRKKSAS